MPATRGNTQSLTFYNPRKAYKGYTLFTPMTGEPSNTWLIDMQGRIVHRWKLPGWVRFHAELLPTGNLLFGCLDRNAPLAELACTGGLVYELDWDGNKVWEYQDPYLDAHDRSRLKNGNTMVQKEVKVPEKIAAKVQGGIPGTELNGEMYGYCLYEVTREGEVVWEWLTYEHLDPELDAIGPLGTRTYWPGWNSIEELPDGNIMTTSFNTNNIYIIDRKTGDIKWRWGNGYISMPHDPTMLDNGNVLVFDNGRYNPTWWPPDYSRVIEVNPNTNEIEWEYSEQNPVDFYSTYISGAQRLPNGNTLICEGAYGRFFEVTPQGEMVWEYVNPFYNEGPPNTMYRGQTNAVFRCQRYSPDYPGLQGKKFDLEKMDLWNRLYGPEGFTFRSIRSFTVDWENACQKNTKDSSEESNVEYKESSPSNAKKTKIESNTEKRMKSLGY